MTFATKRAGATTTGNIGSATIVSSATRWQELFGCPAPQRLPSLVEQAIAWREQVLLHGDVSGAVTHDLQLAVEHALQRRGIVGVLNTATPAGDPVALAGLRVGAGGSAANADGAALSVGSGAPSQPVRAGSSSRTRTLPPAASQLLPGSQLIKAYGGRNHIVAVEAEGFRYEGETFSSLSAIAKHITGTHWNGLLFFGLRKRRSYPPKPRRHG